jgi:hypothetical protein
MSSRTIYKHQFYKTNWSERFYFESNLGMRRAYRKSAKEFKKKDNIETILFDEIDTIQLEITKRNEKRKERQNDEY